MKKKILSFLFALCLLVPCAFIFAACGETPPPEKYIQSISASVKNNELVVDGSTIYCTYGSIPTFSKDDFEVTANYNDSSTAILGNDEYELNLGGLSSTSDVGYYDLLFESNGSTCTLSVYVSEIKLAMPMYPEHQYTEFTYDGTEHNFLDYLDTLQTQNNLPTISSLIDAGLVEIDEYCTPSATNADDYYFTINTTQGVILGEYSTSLELLWRIKPVVLQEPTLSQDAIYFKDTWDEQSGKLIGQEQSIIEHIDWKGLSETQVSELFDIGGETTGTEVSSYRFDITFKEDNIGNYIFQWDYAHENQVSLFWSIEPMRIDLPSLVTDEFTYKEDGNIITFDGLTEDFKRRTLIMHQRQNVSYDDVLKTGDASDYNYIDFRLNEETLHETNSTYNYKFYIDGEPSGSVGTQERRYKVNPATYTLPANTNDNIKFFAEYFGLNAPSQAALTFQASDVYITRFKKYSNATDYDKIQLGFTNEAWEFITSNNFKTSYAAFSWANNAKNNAIVFDKAGTYYADLEYRHDGNNYLPVTIENVEITIAKYELLVDGRWETYCTDDDAQETGNFVFSGYNQYRIVESDHYTDYVNVYSNISYKKDEASSYSPISAQNCTEVGCYKSELVLEYKTDAIGLGSWANRINATIVNSRTVEREPLVLDSSWQITPYVFSLRDTGTFNSNASTVNSFYNRLNYSIDKFDYDDNVIFYKEDTDWTFTYNNNWREDTETVGNGPVSYDGLIEELAVGPLITDKNDYKSEGVAPTITVYYKSNEAGDYQEHTGPIHAIGFYKVVVNLNLVNPNLQLDNSPVLFLEIIPNTVDLNDTTWDTQNDTIFHFYDSTTITGQELINVPHGVKYIANTYRNAGTYTNLGELTVPDYVTVENATNFTLTEGEENTANTYTHKDTRKVVIDKYILNYDELAKYFAWDNTTFVYDGTEKSISYVRINEMPDFMMSDLSIGYEFYMVYQTDTENNIRNSATEVGTYKAQVLITLQYNAVQNYEFEITGGAYWDEKEQEHDTTRCLVEFTWTITEPVSE